jgi:hypothetical protein
MHPMPKLKLFMLLRPAQNVFTYIEREEEEEARSTYFIMQ